MILLSAFSWLVHGVVASTILLALAALAIAFIRQPADRLRLIQWSLASTLCALVLVGTPQVSAYSLGVLNVELSPGALPLAESSAAPELSVAESLDGLQAPLPVAARADDPGAAVHAAAPIETAANSASSARAPQPPRVGNLREFLSLGICLLYALGASLFCIRWARARRQLADLRRRAREVSPEVHAELARITGPTARPVSLLESDEVAGPITWGVQRPVIVIPSSVLRDPDTTRLRYYLAHEWAHVARRDFATWHFATLMQVLLYYQPLFWWLRRRLAICMDQLADADASEQGESTTDYAEFLVKLARLRLAPNSLLTLGIGDKRSSLRERVVFLLNRVVRPRATCPPMRSLMIGIAALLVAVFVSVVRLDARRAKALAAEEPRGAESLLAAISADDQPAASTDKPKDDAKPKPESITYDGYASDGANGKPIEGVKVIVWHKLSRDPKTGGWSTIGSTEHITDDKGKYQFTLPPEEVAEDSLYIEVEAHHPNYASMGRGGYSHSMIRRNLGKGEPPFYRRIVLWPGEAITGTVVNPEGQPLSDVDVSMYAASDKTKGFGRGSFGKAKTDAEGKFRIVPPTPGDGVLWLKPEQYSPQAHRIADRRGDWGRMTMERGTTVKGRVLDAKGAAVAGVRVEARSESDGEKADEYLRTNAVATGILRNAVTGADGEYVLGSLPNGSYDVSVEPNRREDEYDPPPLAQVFLREKLTITDGKASDPYDIRAVPHVVIKGTYVNGEGKPCAGHEISLFGRMDKRSYFANSSTPGKDGKFEAIAPHGMELQFDLHTNEHSALRWRMSHNGPLQRGRTVKLGVVEDDVSGFEVVRYTAPILLVKPVDEEGKAVANIEPILRYTRPVSGKEEMTNYTTGGHVSFEKQPDGRWRSSQLLPDEPFSITVKKQGYTATTQELSLAEGKDQEVTVMLKLDPDAEKADDKGAEPADEVTIKE